MTAMIETLNLTKVFGSIRAVDDLSFQVGQGEVLGFLGPNGAGKSTTMKMLTCFMTPTSGTATVCGYDINNDTMAVRRVIGYLPESAPAYEEMSTESFLRFVADIRGIKRSSVDKVIETCALEEVRHQLFETLSKGFKRRVCLAQSIIHDPKVLIMDEPTDGLDPNQKHEVRKLISRMAKDKVIILSTHILEEVEAVCTRAIIIAHGRLVADGTPDQLRTRSKRHGAVTISIRTTDGSASLLAPLESLSGVRSVKEIEDDMDGVRKFQLLAKEGKTIGASVAGLAREKNWEVDELYVEQGRLDEVFRDLTSGPATGAIFGKGKGKR